MWSLIPWSHQLIHEELKDLPQGFWVCLQGDFLSFSDQSESVSNPTRWLRGLVSIVCEYRINYVIEAGYIIHN